MRKSTNKQRKPRIRVAYRVFEGEYGDYYVTPSNALGVIVRGSQGTRMNAIRIAAMKCGMEMQDYMKVMPAISKYRLARIKEYTGKTECLQ